MHSHAQHGNEIETTPLIIIRYNIIHYYIGDNSVTIFLPKPKKNTF